MSSRQLSDELDLVARSAGIHPARYDTSNGNVQISSRNKPKSNYANGRDVRSGVSEHLTENLVGLEVYNGLNCTPSVASGSENQNNVSLEAKNEAKQNVPQRDKQGTNNNNPVNYALEKDTTRHRLPVRTSEELSERSQQLARLEDLLENKLRVDLTRSIQARSDIDQAIAEFSELQTNIRTMMRRNNCSAANTTENAQGQEIEIPKEKQALPLEANPSEDEPLNMQVSLGHGFFVQAKVSDPMRIYMSIGLGFYLHMTLQEADTYVINRIQQLQDARKKVDDTVASISSRMKFIYEGIRQLMDLPADNVKAQREIF